MDNDESPYITYVKNYPYTFYVLIGLVILILIAIFVFAENRRSKTSSFIARPTRTDRR